MRRGRGEPGGAGSARSAPVMRNVPGGSSAADGRAHLGMIERQERHGGFRPDHVRDAGEVVGARPRRSAADSVEVIEEDAPPGSPGATSPAAARSAARCGS